MQLVPSAVSPWSLRRTLLAVLLPALLVFGCAEVWLTYRTSLDAANAAYDRSLLGAIKAMDANISTESGGVAVELPYRMLEFFELTASGSVYFRVATEDGLAEVGNASLPEPSVRLVSRRPYFYDAVYFGENIRVGAYARELEHPLSGRDRGTPRIVIQVAESLESRNAFTHRLVLQAIARDVLLLLVACGSLVLVLSWALRPLQRLRDEISSRSPLDLAPIDAGSAPAEVRPLVEAINHHILRYQEMTSARRRFIDDASHQLRTPLATLRTQLDYARRERDRRNLDAALHALSRQLDHAVRGANQMLALAKADAAAPRLQPLDLLSVAQQAARELVDAALEKQLDFGLEGRDEPLEVMGHAGLLQEAIVNLVHNAIRFAPRQGRVTLHVEREQGEALLRVTDNGPGVPHEDLPRMGERFFRARNAAAGGSGLGLAIAFSVAQTHGGRVTVANVDQGTGCEVVLRLPLATACDTSRQEALIS